MAEMIWNAAVSVYNFIMDNIERMKNGIILF